jgi:hypothetical protein
MFEAGNPPGIALLTPAACGALGSALDRCARGPVGVWRCFPASKRHLVCGEERAGWNDRLRSYKYLTGKYFLMKSFELGQE